MIALDDAIFDVQEDDRALAAARCLGDPSDALGPGPVLTVSDRRGQRPTQIPDLGRGVVAVSMPVLARHLAPVRRQVLPGESQGTGIGDVRQQLGRDLPHSEEAVAKHALSVYLVSAQKVGGTAAMMRHRCRVPGIVVHVGAAKQKFVHRSLREKPAWGKECSYTLLPPTPAAQTEPEKNAAYRRSHRREHVGRHNTSHRLNPRHVPAGCGVGCRSWPIVSTRRPESGQCRPQTVGFGLCPSGAVARSVSAADSLPRTWSGRVPAPER